VGGSGASKTKFHFISCEHFCAQFSGLTKQLLQDEEGQAVTEYILILSITMFGAAALARALLVAFDNGISHLGSELEKSLKTGRAPKSVWEN